jgi:hypothetical protein
MYQFFRDSTFDGNILQASMVVATILAIIALASLWHLKETFSEDLDYIETI